MCYANAGPQWVLCHPVSAGWLSQEAMSELLRVDHICAVGSLVVHTYWRVLHGMVCACPFLKKAYLAIGWVGHTRGGPN